MHLFDPAESKGEIEKLIFRVTQKLAKKIKVVPTSAYPLHDNPFLDWTANLFMVSRRQCIMLTNSCSLYSVVLAGKGITNEKSIAEKSLKCLHEYMLLDSTANLFVAHIAPHMGSATFCKSGDRRVLGSMNELVFLAKSYLLEMRLPLPQVNMRLNETPMSMLEHHNPKLAFLALDIQPKP